MGGYLPVQPRRPLAISDRSQPATNVSPLFQAGVFSSQNPKGTTMAKAGYTAAGVASALSAATAKTILTVLAPAQFGVDLRGFEISLDGATSTAVPVLWELCSLSGATAGTSTAVTIQQEYGRAITAGFTSGTNFTAEPTVLTALYADYIPAFNGLVIRDFPFNGGPDSAVSTGFALRLTAPATVNARGTFRFERC